MLRFLQSNAGHNELARVAHRFRDREVAERPVELALGTPRGLVAELAGPRQETFDEWIAALPTG
jgi:hypothetical protein